MNREFIALFASALSSLLLGATLGWSLGHYPLKAEISQLKADHQKEQIETLSSTLEALQVAKKNGDDLYLVLTKKTQEIEVLKKEKRNALTEVTHNRACLDEPALRVLNNATEINVSDLPEAPNRTSAANGAIATDTDIAIWITEAGAQYGQCRARLSALIAWHTNQPTTREKNDD
jgi:hypothetical protein